MTIKADKRQRTRIHVDARVVLHAESKAFFLDGVTRDISMRGLYAKIDFGFPVGTECQVEIILTGQTSEMTIKLSPAREDTRAGYLGHGRRSSSARCLGDARRLCSAKVQASHAFTRLDGFTKGGLIRPARRVPFLRHHATDFSCMELITSGKGVGVRQAHAGIRGNLVRRSRPPV